MRISYWSSDVCSSDLADAKERRAAFQHLRDEVDFLADEGQVVVVGAHRAAEDHAAGMVFEGVGQFLAKAGTADVEMVAARPQLFADTAGVGTFLKIGRAQCRERGCQSVWTWVVAGRLKKKKQ